MSAFKYFTPKITGSPEFSLHSTIFAFAPNGINSSGPYYIFAVWTKGFPKFYTYQVFGQSQFIIHQGGIRTYASSSNRHCHCGLPGLLSVQGQVLTTEPALFCGTAHKDSFFFTHAGKKNEDAFSISTFLSLVPQMGLRTCLIIFTHLSLNHLRKSSFVISFINIETFLIYPGQTFGGP